MKTGIYVRFKRGRKFENLDIADLTNEEFSEFLESGTGIPVKNWAITLHKLIVDKVDFEKEKEN